MLRSIKKDPTDEKYSTGWKKPHMGSKKPVKGSK